jgi:DNA polymerase III subunit beta
MRLPGASRYCNAASWLQTVTLLRSRQPIWNAPFLNLNAEVTESGTSVVPVASLAAAIKGCEGDLTLEHSGERLTVAGATIPTDCKPESFPELPTFTGEYADIPVRGLQTLISRTVACVSTEESRFTLNGSLFIGSETGLRMVATDGHRLALADMPGAFPTFRVLVPLFALRELLRLKASSVRFGANDGHLFFTTAGRTIITRKLTGNFPDYERVLPRDVKPNSLQIDRAVLLPVVERAVNLQKKERQPILTFNLNGSVHITTVGDTPLDQTLPGEYTGSEIAAGVNPVYLSDWLKSGSALRVELRFGDMKEDKGVWCIVCQVAECGKPPEVCEHAEWNTGNTTGISFWYYCMGHGQESGFKGVAA